MLNESFGQIFELEQVENWSSNYINYNEIMLNIKNLVDYLKEIADKTINQENLNDSKNEKSFNKKSSKTGKDNLSSEDKNIKNNNNSKKVKNNPSPKDEKQEGHISYDFFKEQLYNKLENNLKNENEKYNNNLPKISVNLNNENNDSLICTTLYQKAEGYEDENEKHNNNILKI